jgi:hypothetical protein
MSGKKAPGQGAIVVFAAEPFPHDWCRIYG